MCPGCGIIVRVSKFVLFQKFWAELAELARVDWEEGPAHVLGESRCRLDQRWRSDVEEWVWLFRPICWLFREEASPPLTTKVSVLGPVSFNIFSDGLEKIDTEMSKLASDTWVFQVTRK